MLAFLFLFVYFLVLYRKFDMIVSDSVQQHHQKCVRVILTCAVQWIWILFNARNAAHRQRYTQSSSTRFFYPPALPSVLSVVVRIFSFSIQIE